MNRIAEIKEELVAIAAELDRRNLRDEADMVTRILAKVVEGEGMGRQAAVGDDDPEVMMELANALDEKGKFEEADRLTAAARRVAMRRRAQGDPSQWADQEAAAAQQFYTQQAPQLFEKRYQAKRGGGPVGVMNPLLEGQQEFNQWKNTVWDNMAPVQQEKFRSNTGMAALGKSEGRELYDYWKANVQPTASGKGGLFGGTPQQPAAQPQQPAAGQQPATDGIPQVSKPIGAAAPGQDQANIPIDQLQQRIQDKRNELQFLMNTLQQRGGK